MNTQDNDPLHVAINAKLASIVLASPTRTIHFWVFRWSTGFSLNSKHAKAWTPTMIPEQATANCSRPVWHEAWMRLGPESTEKERLAVYQDVRDSGWNSLSFGPHDDGPYIWIEGVFQGRQVYIQILVYPPEGEEPGMKFDTNKKKHQR